MLKYLVIKINAIIISFAGWSGHEFKKKEKKKKTSPPPCLLHVTVNCGKISVRVCVYVTDRV